MPAYTLHLLPETRTPGRPIVGGGTENCAVMAENAERLMRPRSAAIISLSLSSNERCRRRENKGGGKQEKKKGGRCCWDANATSCWQFGVWIPRTYVYSRLALLCAEVWLSSCLALVPPNKLAWERMPFRPSSEDAALCTKSESSYSLQCANTNFTIKCWYHIV